MLAPLEFWFSVVNNGELEVGSWGSKEEKGSVDKMNNGELPHHNIFEKHIAFGLPRKFMNCQILDGI